MAIHQLSSSGLDCKCLAETQLPTKGSKLESPTTRGKHVSFLSDHELGQAMASGNAEDLKQLREQGH